jgi:glutamine---fructose-6-phosphate transaminase (isomerizing)
VKSLGNFPDSFIQEITGQPDALRRAAAGLEDQRAALDEVHRLVVDDAVILTGMGGSYAACYPLAAQIAAAGATAVMVTTAELVHFRSGMVRRSTPIIAVSQSGESAEVVRLVEQRPGHRDRPPLIAVTNRVGSSLARSADILLDTRAGVESGPSTLTFAAGLVVLAAVGRVLMGADPGMAIEDSARSAAAAAASVERILKDGSLDDRVAAWLGSREDVVILGRGPGRAAAEMGALTLKETAGLHAEALEVGQFRHGPVELAGPGLAVVMIATEPETSHLDLALAQELSEADVAVLEVVRDATRFADDGERLRVAIGDPDRSLAPAASIVPIQLLARQLAIGLGREPGTTIHAAKVTTRE